MNLEPVLKSLFPAGYRTQVDGLVAAGEGQAASGSVAWIGSREPIALGIDDALALSDAWLRVLRETPGRPILMLVDNRGQKMGLEEERLGLHDYLAHLVKLQDLAMRRGHKVLALVHGESMAGAFIAWGLCAGRVYALADSHTSVMALPAMARVTKLPLERLEALSRQIPVFAPGVDNFMRTGGLHGLWEGDLSRCLEQALAGYADDDNRAQLGKQRGGRLMAAEIMDRCEA